MIQHERLNLDIIEGIIEKEGIKEKVDFWRGDLCESGLTEALESSAAEVGKEPREAEGFETLTPMPL